MKKETITKRNSPLYLSLLAALLLLVSCADREAYYEFQELKDATWGIDQVLLFEIDSTDVVQGVRYDLAVEITNNIDYPYQNLWLFSEYNKDDSTTISSKDEYVLADEFGKWEGAGFASLYQSSHVVMRGITFDSPKNYKVYIRHGMKDQELYGIEKVGMKIYESGR